HQRARNVHVVVFDKDDATPELGTASMFENIGDELLAARVFRMCFARKQELHRSIFVIEDGGDAIHILENQVAALVRGEAAREPDGQRFRVKDLVREPYFSWRSPAPMQLRLEALSRERDQSFAPPLMRAP